jgi:NADP-dependent 3-hydroxy acid dehydrogenase YdfG
MNGKVIVVTGASAGIGASVCELVGGRGASVVLVARREKELGEVAARSGESALAVTADVTRRADVERARDAALERFGHIDVWVNNAGRGITRFVSELTDEDVDDMMTTNLKSALYGMQAVLPHFKARKRGHVINVSSLLGRMPLAAFRSAYSASKHALNALTANLRTELRQDYPDIFVSSVHPGIVATEFGVKSLHGGIDSRRMPGAQPVEEVAGVIADLIATPRADVYTRPGMREMVASYFAAEDMARVETDLFRPPSK